MHLVSSCGLPLGLLTAAFGRRLCFSMPPHYLGPWICTEGALDLRFVSSCELAGAERGFGLVFGAAMWASVGFPHSGLRPPAFFLIPPQLVGPLALNRRGLGLVFGFVMWASVGSPHNGLRPPAFCFCTSPLVGPWRWTCTSFRHVG